MNYGQYNIAFGWIWMVLGITTGAILSLWSFDGPFRPPPGHARYDDLPRRLIRLAHVACFMLPVINILYGQHLDTLPFSQGTRLTAAVSMLVLMVGIPVSLYLASLRLGLKYLNVTPITAGFIGLGIMAWGQWLRL